VARVEEAGQVDVEIPDLPVGRAHQPFDTSDLVVVVPRAHLEAAHVGELVRELRALVLGDRCVWHVLPRVQC
jgi:hypothetical protein